MKGIKLDRFRRFLSTILLTSMLLIILAGLQQACTNPGIHINNQVNGGDVGDISASSGSGANVVNNLQFEDAEERQNLPADVADLNQQFRDKMLEWDSSSQTMSSSFRRELGSIVDEAYNKSKNLSKVDPRRARAAFNVSYWQDFQERVLDGMKQCRKASSLYREALDLYRRVYGIEDNAKNISREDAFIIVELAHWVINRDAGPKHYGGFDGYTEALSLLRLISSNPNLTDEIKYNVLVSQGVAQFGQKRFYSKAAYYFQEALAIYPDSSDVTYNLGSMKAYKGNYREAIDQYSSAIEKNNFARTSSGEIVQLTPDIVRRDLGFAYILQEMFEEPSNQISNYVEAEVQFDMVIQSPSAKSSLKNVARVGKSLALYNMGKIGDAKSELKEAGDSEFAEYIRRMVDSGERNNPAIIDLVKTVSFGNVVPHDQDEDEVLDIYHKLFYCSGDDERIDQHTLISFAL